MKALVVLISAMFFLADMTSARERPDNDGIEAINLVAEQAHPVPAGPSTEPSVSAASENKRVPAALQEFLAGVAGYGQASSFAILRAFFPTIAFSALSSGCIRLPAWYRHRWKRKISSSCLKRALFNT